MSNCSISSDTGSGVGCEGGSLKLRSCAVRNCASNGLVLASDLNGAAAQAQLSSSSFERNGGSGVVVLDGSGFDAQGCSFSRNKRHGLDLRVRANGKRKKSCMPDCKNVTPYPDIGPRPQHPTGPCRAAHDLMVLRQAAEWLPHIAGWRYSHHTRIPRPSRRTCCRRHHTRCVTLVS